VWASGWSEAIVVHNLRDHETKHGERNWEWMNQNPPKKAK
jgi:hypothetical protein